MKEEPIEKYKSAEHLDLKNLNKEFPKVFKKICCPSCQEDIGAENLNLQKSVAKCGNCNVIFSIEEELKSVKTKDEMRQEIFRPEGIDLFFYKDDLDITIQQHIQGLDAYGIFFFPFIAILSTLAFFSKGIPMIIPAVFVLGSFYFIYRAFNYSKYKTYIDINDKFLNIKSRPKNFKKDRSFEAQEIDQLYLKKSADGMDYITIYMIVNGLEGQKHEKLLTVNTLSKAKYLEQEIEKYLNIEERKVPEANVG